MYICRQTTNLSWMAVVDPRVILTIAVDGNADVSSLTLLNNELYLLRVRDQLNQVDVYSTTGTLLRQLSVLGAAGDSLQDMTACSHKQCIYISNEADSCIHRLGLDGSETRWPVAHAPFTLSVTRSRDLLVTCYDDGILLMLNADSGDCIGMIKPDVVPDLQLSHSIEVDNGKYVTCFSIDDDDGELTHLDIDGTVLRSSDIEVELARPWHMAVDSDLFLFVANLASRRIMLFDPSLNYVRDIMDRLDRPPHSLCYDDLTRRLYVGQCDGSVLAIQL